MSKDDLKDNLYWNLLQVSMRAKKNLMRLAEDHGLNVMQLFVLCSIEQDEMVPTNFISSLLTCDASTVTGIIDFLTDRGLMARGENPKDRRVKMLTLTDAGKTMKQQLLVAIRDFDSNALDGLSDQEKQQLQQLLSHIIQGATN